MNTRATNNKPFSTYNGGKESDGTYQKIINIMPPHDIYMELFIGNGAIFRKKKRAKKSIINDLNTNVAYQWNILLWKDLDVSVLNINAIDCLFSLATTETDHDTAGKTLLYLDPPYILEKRKSKRDLYLHEFTEDNHVTLLKYAVALNRYMIIISGFPSELYDSYLTGWNSFEFESSTRHGMQTKKVWFNFDYPTELHDYSYLGDNYRERERIKGIVTRQVSKIKRMPDLERNYLIQELLK